MASDGKPADRYAIVWAEKAGADDDARMVTAFAAAELHEGPRRFKNARMAPATLSCFSGSRGGQAIVASGTSRRPPMRPASVAISVRSKVPDELAQRAGHPGRPECRRGGLAGHDKRSCLDALKPAKAD